MNELESYYEEIEKIAICEIAGRLYEKNCQWYIKSNPMRNDGVFVVRSGKQPAREKDLFYQVPLKFAEKLIHRLNIEIPEIEKAYTAIDESLRYCEEINNAT